MLKLKQLQNNFIDHVINREASEFIQYIKPSNISGDIRLQIYRQTIYENFYNILKITFPGIWKLIGDECARAVCYEYIKDKNNLPKDGYIDDWGSEFPKFLSTLPALKSLNYLEDYAKLEWLQHLSYCASEVPSCNIEELQNIPEEIIDLVQFSFNPSTFFLKSKYSLDVIYELLESPDKANVNLNSKASFIIVTRSENYVKTLWISKEYYEFSIMLSEEKSLNVAATEIIKKNPDFEFSNALSFVFMENLVSSIKIPEGEKCL